MGSTTERARLAALVRRDAAPERIEQARRELAAANISTYIERTLAGAPPLTSAQLAELRALLRPAGK